MSRPYRKYTDEDIIRCCAESRSMYELLRKLNLKPAGGTFANMRKNLQRLGLKCEHWTGYAWNKNARQKDWSGYNRRASLKPHVISLRGHICEGCNNTEWCGKLIPLELHHIDGDGVNNDLSNLQLLCPNCHALTDNWRGRGERIKSQSVYPDISEIFNLVWEFSVAEVAKKYNRTPNALRQHCTKNKIPVPPAGYCTKKRNGQHEECRLIYEAAKEKFQQALSGAD
jgi:hypothetical protein